MAAEVLNYDEVYEKYCDKVKGYIYPKVTNRADAEDLHSAVFIKVYQKFETFDQTKASVSTWVYTIARNHPSLLQRTDSERVRYEARHVLQQLQACA